MSLMASKKMNLLKQLVNHSNDQEILPYIDEQVASRIKDILQQNQGSNFLQEYQELKKDFNAIESKAEIDEINQLYNQNFPNLFDQDQLALKEITVELQNNKKPFYKSITQSKFNKKSPLISDDQDNIKSLGSTCSKFNTLKFYDSNKENLIDKKKSKQKLISYKIGKLKQTPKFNKNSQSSSQLTKIQSIQKTPQKKSISKVNSRTNLNSKQINVNNNKSQSKKNIFDPRFVCSSVKKESFSALKGSQTKNSLISTHKIKSNINQSSMQETAKRQIKSFSSVENNSQVKNFNYQSILRDRSKSKQKYNRKKDMLRKINKMNMEFSAQKIMKKGSIYFGQIEDGQHQNKKTGEKSQNGRKVVTEQPYQNLQSDKYLLSSVDHFEPKNYLREIIVEIYSRQNQRLEQKQRLQQKILKLKQKITAQNRRYQQTSNKNNKLVREIETVSQFQKSVRLQREVIQKSLNENKRKVKSLKSSLTQKKQILKEIQQNQIKEQQQLIQMYENVIDELRKQIRQQNRKKIQIKGCLQKLQKKLQNKQSRFKSTLQSTQKIKNDLTDAFKEWA